MLTNDAIEKLAAAPHFARLDKVWRFLVDNAKEIRNTTIAAAVGAVVSQVAFPALAPYVDLYSFATLGVSPWNPRFLVVANIDDVLLKRSKPGDLLSVTRLFCGGTKLCVTRQIAPDRSKRAAAWPFDPDDKERVKTLVIGHDDTVFTAAYVDQKSSKPGYLELPGQLAVSGDYVGKGMGCHINMKTNKTTTDPFYAYVVNRRGVPTPISVANC